MAGSYAKIYNEIWADQDFRNLARSQQWLFFALISQPELNFAGVITTTERRLTGCAAGFTTAELRDDLTALQARRYIVVDEEHDEILVRSYIRHDGAWRTPNVLTSIIRAATAVRSTAIRTTLAEEFGRLALDELSGKKAEEMRVSVVRVIETLKPRVPVRVTPTLNACVTEPFREGITEPIPEPIGQPIAEPIVVVAVVVEEVKDRTSVSLPQDPSPPSEPESEGVLIEPPVKKPKPECGSDQDPDFAAFWSVYPRKVGKPSARTAWRKLMKDRIDPKSIITAAEAFRDDPERRRQHKRFTPHPSTWLNDERFLVEDDDNDVWTWNDVEESAPAEFN
ncbi:hypothetical protein GCM10017673_40290 [Streptosporangium violaceochromogenes]|nr:hypothetical protein GCM10017673_40290 [Streptosporangium violaceochromogenes]